VRDSTPAAIAVCAGLDDLVRLLQRLPTVSATAAALVRPRAAVTSSSNAPPPPGPPGLVRVEDFTAQVARGAIAVAEGARPVDGDAGRGTRDAVVVERFTSAADTRTVYRDSSAA
jgi:hypothetical protein